MIIDKELETPMGVVRFKGEVSEEEFDHIVKCGLLVMLGRGQIKLALSSELSEEGPEDGDEVH